MKNYFHSDKKNSKPFCKDNMRYCEIHTKMITGYDMVMKI